MSRMTVNADCCALKENIQNAKLRVIMFSLKEVMMKRTLGGIGWENCFNVFGTLLEMSWLRT